MLESRQFVQLSLEASARQLNQDLDNALIMMRGICDNLVLPNTFNCIMALSCPLFRLLKDSGGLDVSDNRIKTFREIWIWLYQDIACDESPKPGYGHLVL